MQGRLRLPEFHAVLPSSSCLHQVHYSGLLPPIDQLTHHHPKWSPGCYYKMGTKFFFNLWNVIPWWVHSALSLLLHRSLVVYHTTGRHFVLSWSKASSKGLRVDLHSAVATTCSKAHMMGHRCCDQVFSRPMLVFSSHAGWLWGKRVGRETACSKTLKKIGGQPVFHKE